MCFVSFAIGLSVLLSSFEATFKKVSEFELKPQKTMIYSFTGMAADSKQNLILVDPLGKQVLIFNGSGVQIGNLGGVGKGPGEFEQPLGISVSSRGEIYVSDNSARRVSVFDRNYRYIRSFLIRTDHWVPRRLRVDDNAIFMAAPQMKPPDPFNYLYIEKYDARGKFIKSFFPPSKALYRQYLTNFSVPILDISEDHFIYAVQSREYRIYKIDLDGKTVDSFGEAPKYFKPLKGFSSKDATIKFLQIPYSIEKEDYYHSGSDIDNLLIYGKYVVMSVVNYEDGNEVYYIDIYDRFTKKRTVSGVRTTSKLLTVDASGTFYFLTHKKVTEYQSLYRVGKFKLSLE
ncbi:MAG: NHL repeat-containing protein [Bacteroidota bacterium]